MYLTVTYWRKKKSCIIVQLSLSLPALSLFAFMKFMNLFCVSGRMKIVLVKA